MYLLSGLQSRYRVLIELREFDTKIKKQNRELALLRERHDEKKNEMGKLGKDCQKIVCHICVVCSCLSECR